MQKTLNRASAIAAALVLIGAASQAHVLDKNADASAFRLRSDVAKQQAKYMTCLMKASTRCERDGLVSGPECDLTTGVVSYEGFSGSATFRFQSNIEKCDLRLVLTKQGTDYEGIGCPGDCDPAAGVQRCATLAAYEASVEATSATGAKAKVGQLRTAMDAACAGNGAPNSPARIACVDRSAKEVTKYLRRVSTCEQACENDVKGTKGAGAATNASVCLVGPGAHASLTACEQSAARKLTAPGAAGVASLAASLVNAGTDDVFNREATGDPDSPAGTLSPCGTCGDGAREGTEDCDGSVLGACEACAADCTCTPAVCGNGVIEGAEECDGATLGTCTTSCLGDCSCAPPVCGNEIIEGTEECDGATLGTCTTSCLGDCTCAPADLDDPILDGPAGSFCSSTFNAASSDFQPLCVPTAGSGHHFRMEGVNVLANNGFFYLALGFPAGATGNPATTVGDGRFIFTGGKSVSCSFGWSFFRYSGLQDPSNANLCVGEPYFGDYHLAPQEVCVDVSGHLTPSVTFWVTGHNGANCKDRSTLTLATASFTKDDWASANNQPVKDVIHYMKVNNTSLATMQQVLVSSNTVLDYGPVDPILDGPTDTFCETAFNATTSDYQQLCVPTAGSGRHFRIEDAEVLANNGFFYLAMGFPAGATGNPATTVGDGRFIFTGGKSVSCSFGWSYFRYSGLQDPTTPNLCVGSPIFGDYHLAPQEVCLDVTGENPPRVTFWVTGQDGGDCRDRSTLTAASALYEKADWASANNQPVSETVHYVKVNNTSLATVGNVAVSSRLVLD